MARFPTFSELKLKAEVETDMQGEDFITFDEWVGMFNDGIDEAEAEVMALNQDYYLAETTLAVVNGTAEYDLPSDIYAQKIRAITHHNGADIYPIRRMARLWRALEKEAALEYGTPDHFRYHLKHQSSSDGFKIVLIPTPTQTLPSDAVKVEYIRNANRVPLSTEGSEAASNAIVIDLPEIAQNFLVSYVKERAIAKEQRGSQSHIAAEKHKQDMRAQMVAILAKRIVDDDDEIEQDLNHYWDSI